MAKKLVNRLTCSVLRITNAAQTQWQRDMYSASISGHISTSHIARLVIQNYAYCFQAKRWFFEVTYCPLHLQRINKFYSRLEMASSANNYAVIIARSSIFVASSNTLAQMYHCTKCTLVGFTCQWYFIWDSRVSLARSPSAPSRYLINNKILIMYLITVLIPSATPRCILTFVSRVLFASFSGLAIAHLLQVSLVTKTKWISIFMWISRKHN